ncbi:hypothetical protein K501DRAFT_204438 [Backusella circina FSU 941]|nr:hypothetical protein K501DRAFT_204438 [Backusella circina FSU 941]
MTTPALHHAYPHTNTLVSPTTTTTHHLQRTISSDSNQTSPPSLFQRQKLRQAIISQLDDEQMKDVDHLVDLIQSLRKRELSLCLFNPVYLRQKIIEAYRALYFSFGDEKPSTTTTVVTTPSLVHHQLEHGRSEDSVESLLASLEGMSLNKKKRKFGDIFFPHVKATGVRRAPKITIQLLDTVPLDKLAFVMYNKPELTRMAQNAAIEINC